MVIMRMLMIHKPQLAFSESESEIRNAQNLESFERYLEILEGDADCVTTSVDGRCTISVEIRNALLNLESPERCPE